MQMLVDFEERTLTLDGVVMRLEVLAALINPDQAKYYHFVRQGDVVTIEQFRLPQPDPDLAAN